MRSFRALPLVLGHLVRLGDAHVGDEAVGREALDLTLKVLRARTEHARQKAGHVT